MKLLNLITNMKNISLFAENVRLKKEIEQLNRILDAEHRRANINEKYAPNY